MFVPKTVRIDFYMSIFQLLFIPQGPDTPGQLSAAGPGQAVGRSLCGVSCIDGSSLLSSALFWAIEHVELGLALSQERERSKSEVI